MSEEKKQKVKPSYYAIIPANVRYCEDLPDKAKLLYGEISCLAQGEQKEAKYCWANNQYFADLYGVHKNTISKLISLLVKYEFIAIEIIREQKQVKERRIYIDPLYVKTSIPYKRKRVYPINEKLKDINTSINITSINDTTYHETDSFESSDDSSKETINQPEQQNHQDNPFILESKNTLEIIRRALASGGWGHRLDPHKPSKLILRAMMYIDRLLIGTMFGRIELDNSGLPPGSVPQSPLSAGELESMLTKSMQSWVALKDKGAIWAKKMTFPDWIYNPRSKKSMFLSCLNNPVDSDQIMKNKITVLKGKLKQSDLQAASNLLFKTKRKFDLQEIFEYWRSISDITVWSREHYEKLKVINKYSNVWKSSLCQSSGQIEALADYLTTWKTWNPSSISPGKAIWMKFVSWLKQTKDVNLNPMAKVPAPKIKTEVKTDEWKFQQLKPEERSEHEALVLQFERDEPDISWIDAQEKAADIILSKRKTG